MWRPCLRQLARLGAGALQQRTFLSSAGESSQASQTARGFPLRRVVLIGLGAAAGGVAWHYASRQEVVDQEIVSEGGKAIDGSTANEYTAQWRIYTDRARAHAAEGEVERAERLMQRALQVARQGWGESDPHVAAALNNLAEVYQLAGKTAEAEALYLDAVERLTREYGKNDVRTAMAMYNTGRHFHAAGNWTAAKEWLARSLDARRAVLGPAHPQTVQTVRAVAKEAAKHGSPKEALDMLHEHLGTLQSAGQGASEGAAARSVMLCMAQIHAAAGDPAKEAAVLRTVVESARTAASHADKDGEVKANLEAAQAGEKLAHALVALGTTGAAGKVDSWLPGRGSKRLAPQARAALFEEAQSILQQSLSTFTVLYGPKSPSVAGALAGMADVAMKAVRAGGAEGGEADPAQLLRCVNQADSAVAILQEILDKAGATLAAAQHVPLHARLLGSRPAAGVPPGTRKQLEELLPAVSQALMGALHTRAQAEQCLGRLDEAEASLQRALAVHHQASLAELEALKRAGAHLGVSLGDGAPEQSGPSHGTSAGRTDASRADVNIEKLHAGALRATAMNLQLSVTFLDLCRQMLAEAVVAELAAAQSMDQGSGQGLGLGQAEALAAQYLSPQGGDAGDVGEGRAAGANPTLPLPYRAARQAHQLEQLANISAGELARLGARATAGTAGQARPLAEHLASALARHAARAPGADGRA